LAHSSLTTLPTDEIGVEVFESSNNYQPSIFITEEDITSDIYILRGKR